MSLWLIPVMAAVVGLIVWRLGKRKRPEPQPQASSRLRSDELRWAFLAYFRYPREIAKDPWIASWSDTLGRPYREVIRELLDQGYLRLAGTKEKLAIKLRVQDLKNLLAEHELKVSGKKEELLNRLIEACPHEASEAVAAVGDIYLCTAEGLQSVDEYEKRLAERRRSADLEIRMLLAAEKVEQAVEAVKRFDQTLPRPPAENTVNKDEVMAILDISQVPGLSEAEVEEGRLRVAAEVLWEGKISGRDLLASHAQVLLGRKRSIAELKGYADQEFISGVEILCCDDSCRRCKAVAGKKYSLKKAPLIPVEGCTHEMGCRCCYTPIVD